MAIKTLRFNMVFDDQYVDPKKFEEYWNDIIGYGWEHAEYDEPWRKVDPDLRIDDVLLREWWELLDHEVPRYPRS